MLLLTLITNISIVDWGSLDIVIISMVTEICKYRRHQVLRCRYSNILTKITKFKH